jgi:AraC family transcriptional regulator
MTGQPRIESTKQRSFIGQKLSMSLANNRTQELWANFRPRLGEITNRLGDDFFNLQVYPEGYYKNFNPANEFEAYALVEVIGEAVVPENMLQFNLPAGKYAVFIHQGGPATASETFQYILTQWLPASDYVLDQRPHFEVLGNKYKHNDPASEEEIWVPVSSK